MRNSKLRPMDLRATHGSETGRFTPQPTHHTKKGRTNMLHGRDTCGKDGN